MSEEKRDALHPEELSLRIQEIGLKWPVSWDMDYDGITCRVHVQDRTHNIRVDKYTREDPDGRYFHPLHELAHCKLSEEIDPCFSALQCGHEADSDECRRLYLIYVPIDVWVNQERHKHWPEAMRNEQVAVCKEMVQIAKQNSYMFFQPELLLTLALSMAEDFLFDTMVGEQLRRIKNYLPPALHGSVAEIRKAIVDMGQITPCVESLQYYMREFARILSFEELIQVRLEYSARHQCQVVYWKE